MNAEVVEQDAGRAGCEAGLCVEWLEARLHAQTAGRLSRLRVRRHGDLVCIAGLAPSYHVRQLAEQAALRLVTDSHLCFEIEVSRPVHAVAGR